MKLHLAFSSLGICLLLACHASTGQAGIATADASTESSNVELATGTIPLNLEQLVAAYQATSGLNITYDEKTQTLLRSIAVERIGPPELGVLRIATQ